MTELSNKRETKSSAETGNKERLPFTDSAIQKWDPLFNLLDPNSRNGVKLGKHA